MVSLQQLTPAPLHRLVDQVHGLLRSRLWLKVFLAQAYGIELGMGGLVFRFGFAAEGASQGPIG